MPFLHIKGARKFEELQNGNVLISLNAASSLGPKGTVIEAPKDVKNLLDNWKSFDRNSWSSSFSNIVTLEAVKEFWLSGTNTHRNTYLRK